MSEAHRIDLPRIVVVGRGVIGRVGEICGELGFVRALIVTGSSTYEIAGRIALKALRAEGLRAEVAKVNDVDMVTVDGVSRKAHDMTADVVLGVGGGRTIDVAKLGAKDSMTSFVSVPTTASHDGIASSLASIKGLEKPYSVKANAPIAVVADSRIVAESPYRLTASGCGDVVSKVTAVRDWMLAHEVKGEYYGDYAGSLALMSASMVMKNARQIRDQIEAGYRTLLEALVSCGVAMSIAGSSRPCSGSEHLFSHALDVIAPRVALHGEQCGVGTIMMAKLHGLDWGEIANSLRSIGAPTSAKELGIDRGDIVRALVKAKEIRPERYTILDKVNLTDREAETLASECEII